jgi:acyl-CoA dehydrogenase
MSTTHSTQSAGYLDVETIRVFLASDHLALAEEIESNADATISTLPICNDDTTARAQARAILDLLGQGGWLRYAVPAEFGGISDTIDLRACCLIRESLAARSPLADAVFALQCLGSMPLALAADREQKQQWLPRVSTGQAMAAFAMTEDRAGSDVRAMTTTAVREGDAYRLEGRKTFISNAGIADFYTSFAVTGKDERGRSALSCFLIPADTSGLTFASPQVMSAPHPLGEMAYKGCCIPASHRLGDEGEGFELGMRTLDRLRVTVAAAACGMAARALAEATQHVKNRAQFGKKLCDFQLIQQKLAGMATDLAAARLLTYRAAWETAEATPATQRLTLRSAMAKFHATEAAQRVIDDAVQIFGGAGVMADHPVDLLYRSVRALRIYEGTSEIQQLIIARELLKD